ncbi:MAG TPA: MBL fold metallo-hydrolase, partial [Chloroflexota bacterium]
MVTNVEEVLNRLVWLGHDAFRLGGALTVYLDPYQIPGGPLADVVLITHDHFDHFSKDDIARVRKPSTIFVGPPNVVAELSGDTRAVRPGDALAIGDLVVETVPAYNVTKFRAPGVPFHPREAGGLGYIITTNGVRVYHAGDTDLTPEVERVRADIALLPVSGTYVMTAEEAAEAAARIRPQVAVPMHYGSIVG